MLLELTDAVIGPTGKLLVVAGVAELLCVEVFEEWLVECVEVWVELWTDDLLVL